jgi:dynein heavy chain 2
VARIRRNLRVVLAMDPTNTKFTSRCQSNPAIFTQCSIQWIESWSKQGLARIPGFVMPEISKAVGDQVFKDIVRCMLQIHESSTKIGGTPIHFTRFAETFRAIYNSKKESKTEQQSHLKAGLSKLNEANDSVAKLSKDAETQKVLLAQKRIQQQEALKQIQASMTLSVQETTNINEIQAKIGIEEQNLEAKRLIINERLANVKPILEGAKEAVGKLKTDNLNEIKALAMPPPTIQDILVAVVRLLGQADTSWKSIKKFLGERGVINQIMNFDARSCSPKLIQEVKSYVQKQSSSFEEENARRGSIAAAPLAKWVRANISYAEVLTQVGPLEQELSELNQSQMELNNKLRTCQNKLLELTQKIDSLQREYEDKVAESARIKNEVEKAEKTLEASENLLGKLSGERDRWSKQYEEEEKLIKALPKLVLLSAAFITYLPQAAEDVRKSVTKQWLSFVKLSDSTEQSFDLKAFMSSESEMLKYKAEGLPADDLSMENAIAILNTVQYPLVIDPSQQATLWLQTNMMQKSIECINPQDPKFATTLELAVRFGKTLLIQEIDSIDPILFPLLRQEILVQGPRKSVRLGEKIIDFNEEFRLFLITRNPDINLSPDSGALMTQINFTVTRSGLEGQLLGLTIQHERPELETKKSECLQKEEASKIQLSDLEKQLLNELANAKGDILENVSLINKLTQIKKQSQTIMESLVESARLKEELDQKRETYRPFARNGSRLYFLIGDMKRVNPMYQFSLAVFLTLFQQALESKSDKAANLEARIALLSEGLQKVTFNYISRSLFKEDRLLFAMHIVHGLFPELFIEDEWNFFIGAVMKQQQSNANTQAPPRWVTADRKPAYASFVSNLPELANTIYFQSDLTTG